MNNMPTGKPINGVKACRTTLFLMLLFPVIFPAMVLGQVSSNEINYFSRCRNISDVQERASCYDKLYDQAVRAVTPRNDESKLREENRRMREELARIREQTGVTHATGQAGTYENIATYPVSPRGNKAEEFGKDEEPYVVKGDSGEEELIGTIAALQKCPTGWIVTLEKGQVWRQMLSKDYLLREGQKVRIYPTMWGKAYRLSVVDGSGYIQVERIQ